MGSRGFKFHNKITRCNNSQIKILCFLNFHFFLTKRLSIKSETANDVIVEQNASQGEKEVTT